MWIVDASVAVKWVVEEPLRDVARDLLGQSEELYAPDFVLVEVASALAIKAMRQEISLRQAIEGAKAIERFYDQLQPTQQLIQQAMKFAFAIEHPVYDCLYLACAEALTTVVVTADSRFDAKAKSNGFGHRIMSLVAVLPHQTS